METMFWTRLKKLCADNNTTPTGVCKEVGLSTGSPPMWKRGSIPNQQAREKIAAYFNVSPDFFIGEEKENSPSGELDRDRIKFALFGTDQIDDAKLDEVLRYAAYVKDL